MEDQKTPSLLSFDQVVKFDTESVLKLVAVLVLFIVLTGLLLRLTLKNR